MIPINSVDFFRTDKKPKNGILFFLGGGELVEAAFDGWFWSKDFEQSCKFAYPAKL